MAKLDNVFRDGFKTQHYRVALWSSQAVSALLVVAALASGLSAPSLVLVAALSLIALQFAVSKALGDKSVAQIREHQAMVAETRAARHKVEELFTMTDMLQSAEDHDDAGLVLEVTTRRLLPGFGGALYVFNNSHDRLDLARSWCDDGAFVPAETLVPGNCWALKRGKPHLNDPQAGTLCCMHHSGEAATLELPMIARGTVHGLLMIAAPESSRLEEVMRMGGALADSISLALSNIALREKLRTQSLRDPLTGLYNRRYMEDALDRYLAMAERSKDPTSVIMIDLDHFKHLNDEHGHAKGDAVLRDVAGQLVSALRPADVVSRYGGEELLVILPACPLEDAALKGEMLRARIEGLSDSHGVPISASFGVASVPETSAGKADVVPMADAALYEAKQAGRNCVRTADPRSPGTGDSGPRLAVG